MPSDWLRPDWAAPAAVKALMSTRQGGSSAAPFESMNLARPALPAVDDAVDGNRRRLAAALGATPVYLQQVHGSDVVQLGCADLQPDAAVHRADASVTSTPGLACTVLVADCLPVLFCAGNGRAVAAAHAGWRGLAAGVLENTVAGLCRRADCAPAEVQAWLGPCIGPRQFEVGADVLEAFGLTADLGADAAFVMCRRADGSTRWLADLPELARRRLGAAGVARVFGGCWCTVEEPSRFFSFRRDGLTGRMAACIALAS